MKVSLGRPWCFRLVWTWSLTRLGVFQKKLGFSPKLLPLVWIFLSSLLTMYNKYVFSYIGIRIPIFLTLIHLSCMSFVAVVINKGSCRRAERWWSSRRHLLVLAVCQGASIVLRNNAYMYMSVSALQVLSAFSPAWVYYLSITMGFEPFRLETFCYILGITAGTALASMHTFRAELVGCLLQGSGILLEGVRTVSLKTFIQNNRECSMTDILMVSSLCSATLLLGPALVMEGDKAYAILELGSSRSGQLILGNAVVAVLLNIVSLEFVRTYPATFLSVSAVSKDLILVFLSPLMFGTHMEADHMWYILSALTTCLYVIQKKRYST